MKFSVITPNFNGALFLEQTLQSVLEQRQDVDVEYIVIDGGSTDGSIETLKSYGGEIDHCIIESDSGPANAINKGLQLATGDIVSWLNADDIYYPQTLVRIEEIMKDNANASMCFGGCRIVDALGGETRGGITRFKELFFPLSSRFTYQCINYISQPALFFRQSAVEKAGLLREDMLAAWDYEYILRMWRHGTARRLKGTPLAAFRWHEQSISGQNFRTQFREEYEAAIEDAGILSFQAGIHLLVRLGIVGIYSAMSAVRSASDNKQSRLHL